MVGWRRGYAPDCKAPHIPCAINAIARNSYQDKAGTAGERDNTIKPPIIVNENENPGALAGATGATFDEWFERAENNMRRERAASNLARSAVECDPADRIEFLEILIDVLSPGYPVPNPYGRLMAEAREWARIASTAERKAYCLACFEALNGADQAAFLKHVQDARAAA